SGVLLRDLGYAEKAPAASCFSMDEQDGLMLTTEYETMAVWERFSFAGPDVRIRSSTVEGLSNNASFCLELRLPEGGDGASGTASSRSHQQVSLSPLGW
ncbi:MAG: phycobiliprotein lyase, partial [Synechococcaceae bacterium WB9_4xC_028]|nr:phycobiliprotein lyase [Synechococcaceae bacterium WB9_4xC_028]